MPTDRSSPRADQRDGDGLLGQLLAVEVMPTALLVDTDELAMSLLGAMSGVGLRAPEDLSVLGFDDHALAAPLGLSTIAQPVPTLGEQAAEMALDPGRRPDAATPDRGAPDPAGAAPFHRPDRAGSLDHPTHRGRRRAVRLNRGSG